MCWPDSHKQYLSNQQPQPMIMSRDHEHGSLVLDSRHTRTRLYFMPVYPMRVTHTSVTPLPASSTSCLLCQLYAPSNAPFLSHSQNHRLCAMLSVAHACSYLFTPSYLPRLPHHPVHALTAARHTPLCYTATRLKHVPRTTPALPTAPAQPPRCTRSQEGSLGA